MYPGEFMTAVDALRPGKNTDISRGFSAMKTSSYPHFCWLFRCSGNCRSPADHEWYQKLLNRWKTPAVVTEPRSRRLFLTLPATLVHLQRLTDRRATPKRRRWPVDGRLSINRLRTPQSRCFVLEKGAHGRASERRPRGSWKASETQPRSTLMCTSNASPHSSVFSKLNDRRGWAHSTGGAEQRLLPQVSLAAGERLSSYLHSSNC